MEEKILTKHPQGKSGRNLDRIKYEMIKSEIIKSLKSKGELSFTDMALFAKENLREKIHGSTPWYVECVKLDLEARKIIKRVPKTKPQLYKLVK